MSDLTKKALDEAIDAHFADTSPDLTIIGYAISVKAIDLNDEKRMTWYKRSSTDQQDFATTLGLFHTAILGMEEYWRSVEET